MADAISGRCRGAMATLALAAAACGGPDRLPAPPLAPAPGVAAPTAAAWSSAPPVASAPAPAREPAPPVDEETEAPPLPAGFVRIGSLPGVPSEVVACGDLRVENVQSANPHVYEPWVRVTGPGGRKVYEAHGRRYDVGEPMKARMSLVAEVCGDLTGDGVAELILTERTIGAHCCYTYYVVSMTSPTKILLQWDKGDSGNEMVPAKLKPGPAWQVRSVDLVMPPFVPDEGDPAVSYAGIPGFPIVFDLVGGAYHKRTSSFAAALRAEWEAERAACPKRKACEPYELYEWGMALLVGDWQRDQQTLVPDAELRAQLDRRSDAMRKKMRAQLGP